MPDYSVLRLTAKEYLTLAAKALAALAVFSYVFYRSAVFFLVLSPAAFLYPFYRKKDLVPARKQRLVTEFREGLSVLAGTLSAGYSMENALEESVRELILLYGEDSMIVREFSHISHLVSMNVPVERAFEEFAERSSCEDIRNFSKVLRVAKRSGGELVPIINHTAETIGDKIQVKEEILTMTASRRFEQSIMNIVPVIIVIYVDLTSPGFFRPMYTTPAGRITMTVCMAIYLFAAQLASRILAIEL